MREGRANIQISRARQMGYWLTVKLRPDMSYPELGRMFCKDHTTILSGRKRGEALKDSAPIRDWLAHPVIVALLEKRGEQ
jgi:chromosomal replication initiation ATPase DnaA